MEMSKFMAALLNGLKDAGRHALTPEERKDKAIDFAADMLNEARRLRTQHEKSIQEQLARMMNDPIGKAFVTSMTDQCFRSQDSRRVADQLVYLIHKIGIPNFLSSFKRLQLAAFRALGRPLADLLVPLTKHMLRQETSNVILPGESTALSKHMALRRVEGVHINLNRLGEAILGEEEAARRLDKYLKDLANPEIECISVKISTIFSQINLLGWEETLVELSRRLKLLYRAAKQNLFISADGQKMPKFVNLDMEEYRDLHLTVELFKKVLDEAEFKDFSAGIVLQSYLPDAFCIQQGLTAWAQKRVAEGGAPIKIRIVKGANLAMEQVEASLKNWPQAPYATKGEVDANYKRMLVYGCQLPHAKAVHLGIASHNLFDIAYALLLRAENHVEEYVCFEMLEGMADHQRRLVQQLSGNMLLYCPAATREEFQNAVAYLVRRLDENTAPENFLRHAFEMLPGSDAWQAQAELFAKACHAIDTVQTTPSRLQNRLQNMPPPAFDASFANEADTDWTLPQNRLWAEGILREWSHKHFEVLPLVLGEQTISTGVALAAGQDPSFPDKTLYQYALAGEKELELALQTAERGYSSWSGRPLSQRLLLLAEVAQKLRQRRGDLIGAMVADTGKTVAEADVEVSEAIDFAEYYRRNALELHSLVDIAWQSKGPVLVAPPWNFPCSIPAGGILAALAAGNAVIFKPAPEAVLAGWQLANTFWEAGIDKEALQFFCCADDPIGSRLIQDVRVKAVILTGATSTAKLFFKLRPGLDLLAETGGKNSLVISRMSDRDLAIKDLIHSAFGHAGQKCSACSLAILEKEVYDDPHFRQQLHDAAASLKVGSPWHLSTRINPLIRTPNPELMRGLTTLEPGEEWLLQPKQDAKNPNLWSPGIKFGVKPGSFMHRTELFGPVLGVMCAKDMAEGVALANATPYGLTAGIHTLDEREQKTWLKEIVAGNCYINRGITGAIVQRQPFGGCKESSFGPGAKAGGPNYLLQLMQPKPMRLPKETGAANSEVNLLHQKMQQAFKDPRELELWETSLDSYAFFWQYYFTKKHDPSQVLGQDNYLCYVPHAKQTLRVQAGDLVVDVLRLVAAALTCQAPFEISLPPGLAKLFADDEWLKQTAEIVFIEEDEARLIERLAAGQIKRLRLLAAPSPKLQLAIAEAACNAVIAPVLANGRLELLHFLREVSVSHDTHRYGYLGLREKEPTPPPPAAQACGSSCGCG